MSSSPPGSSSAGQAAKTAKAAKAAHAAKATATAAGKAGVAVGKGFAVKGALVGGVSFLGRRAAWPAVVLGTAFSGAAWFGAFELASGFMERVLPPPAQPVCRFSHANAALTEPLHSAYRAYARLSA